MKQTFIFGMISILLIGCGSGGGGSNDETMVLDQSYTIKSGNKVVKNSNTAKLKVIHVDKHKNSTIILIEGNATIIRD